MPQFFIKSSDIINGKCIIKGDDYNHLHKARRTKLGDFIDMRFEDGCLYKARVKEIHSKSIIAEIFEKVENKSAIDKDILENF